MDFTLSSNEEETYSALHSLLLTLYSSWAIVAAHTVHYSKPHQGMVPQSQGQVQNWGKDVVAKHNNIVWNFPLICGNRNAVKKIKLN